MRKSLAIILTFCIPVVVTSQENATHFFPHHSLGIMISHTNVSQGVQANGKKKWLALPSWGINYNFKFNPAWAIGLHNDIIIEDFEVGEHLRSGSDKILERNYPVASAVVMSFRPGKHLNFLLGSGGEFAHSGTFFLIRIGAEYGHHINHNWEINANLVNDFKWKAYNSFAIGLGVTRIL